MNDRNTAGAKGALALGVAAMVLGGACQRPGASGITPLEPTAAVSAAAAGGVRALSPTVSVTLDDRGKLLAGGATVRVRVTVSCAAGREVLEAFVYVTQDGYTSLFAPIGMSCQSSQPRRHLVMVGTGPGSPLFHSGAANATAYVLVLDPATGETESAGDARAIELK